MKVGASTIAGMYRGGTAIAAAYRGGAEVFGNAIAALFRASEPGIWLDPSDASTLYTDTAGTTQAAIGQAVARINDKSGNGNHATQSTAAARPTYGIVPEGGRRNLLLQTESYNNANYLVKTNLVFATNIGDPFGTNRASTLTASGGSGRLVQLAGGVGGGVYTNSLWIRRRTGTRTINWEASQVGLGDEIVVTSEWQRFSSTRPNHGTNDYYWGVRISTEGDAIDIFGAQLETGSTATDYQRVGTAFNVTEAGKKSLGYLAFDGVDDFLVTPTITPGTDKAQIFAGIQKASDAARGSIVELSASIASNNGGLHLTAPNAASATFGFESKGTTLTDAVDTGIAAPALRVLSGISDIAGDSATLRINSVQEATNAGDQGTGNYLAYPIYIGARGGTSLRFNGQIYTLVVRFGPNLDAAELTKVEKAAAAKTAGVDL
jgi:hypothetical protein